MSELFTPEHVITVARLGLVVSAAIVLMRLTLNDERRHRLLNFFTHYLNDSHSEMAHRLYRHIHHRLPPFDHKPKRRPPTPQAH
jgi:hypothetical protein